jgi:hypothetical protein
MSLVYDGSTDIHAKDHLSASDSFCLEMLKEEHPQVGVEDSHSYETTDSKTCSIENQTLSQIFASRDSAFQLISQLVSVAQSLKELSNGVSVTPQNVVGDVPPDYSLLLFLVARG